MAIPVFRELSAIILKLVYPQRCIHCGTCRETLPTGLCSSCWNQLEATRLGNWVDKVVNNRGLDRAYSGWFFNDILQSVIHSFKYQDTPKFAFHFGRYLARELDAELRELSLDVLSPVPLHPVKARDRGYNQALWIARGIGKERNIPVRSGFIRRVRYTESQTRLTARQRRENVTGAFSAKRNMTGLTVGVVDDVLTTGSTLSGVAVACKEAGVKSVIGLTLATPKEN